MNQETNWKRIFEFAATILVTALIVGIGTWYVMDQKLKNAKTSQQDEINNLQKQVNDLDNKLSNTQTSAIQSQINNLNNAKDAAEKNAADLQAQVDSLKKTMSGMVIDQDGDGR